MKSLKKSPNKSPNCPTCAGTCEVTITCECGCGEKAKVKCQACDGTGKNPEHRRFEERRKVKQEILPDYPPYPTRRKIHPWQVNYAAYPEYR